MLPKRKKIRLDEYDYSKNGCYFITICAKDKGNIFSCIIGNNLDDENNVNIQLTQIGKIIKDGIEKIPVIYKGIQADIYCIMPDHVHFIIEILQEDKGETTLPNISTVIGCFKRYVSKNVGIPIWQKSFYEHIIRNEKDYYEITGYILRNPKALIFKKYYNNY
ncbi:MAG: hypothetical protein PHW77_09430 [Eubacteriales bacterium]|nr:hypothetical protein [Eubacteriales bacterium]